MGPENLLEREAELAVLEARIAALSGRGEGGVVVVEGLPGIGKSALLASAAEMAERHAAAVLTARGIELESELAFGAVRQLLAGPVMRLGRQEREELLQGPAVLARAVLGFEPGDTPGGLADPLYGLFWLVAGLAERAPLIVLIDDLHWLDEESWRFVAYLARRIEELPVLMITAARPDEPGANREPVASLADVATVIHPGALTPPAVAQILVRALVDAAGADIAAECHRVTGGNPFLVAELTRSLVRGSAIDIGDSLEGLAPSTVARSVLARVGRVSDAAVALAHAVALFPGGSTLTDAAAVAELEPAAAAAAADALVAAGAFAPTDGLAYLHPIMRTAVYDDMGEFARRQGHARAAVVLFSRGAPAEEVAAHLLAGEPSGNDQNVAILRQAADEALAGGALRAAARYLERALAEPPAPEARWALRHDLGRLEAMIGVPAAESTLRAALAEATTPEQVADSAIDLAAVLHGGLDPDAAVAVLLSVRASAERLDRERRLLLDGVLAVAAWHSSRHAELYADIADGLQADLAGTTPGERLAVNAVGTRLFDRCEPVGRVIEVLHRAVGDEPAPLAVCGVDLGDPLAILIACGDLDTAWAHCMARQEQAAAAGRDALYVAAQVGLARIAFLRGEIREAEGITRLALELPGAHLSDVVDLSSLLASVLTAAGRLDEAETALHLADVAAARQTMSATIVARRRADIAAARGRHQEALPVLERAYDALVRRGSTNPAECAWLGSLAVALAGVGRREEAIELLRGFLARAESFGEPRPIGVGHVSLGRILGGTVAREHFERAVTVLEQSPYRLELARAQLELGSALRRANQRVAARPLLRAALDYGHGHGVSLLAARAEEELRATGARPRRLVMTGVDALTPSELRIARMAADGLSNRELAQHLFLTVKTVEMHLGRAYRKLGVSSRGELAEALSAAA